MKIELNRAANGMWLELEFMRPNICRRGHFSLTYKREIDFAGDIKRIWKRVHPIIAQWPSLAGTMSYHNHQKNTTNQVLFPEMPTSGNYQSITEYNEVMVAKLAEWCTLAYNSSGCLRINSIYFVPTLQVIFPTWPDPEKWEKECYDLLVVCDFLGVQVQRTITGMVPADMG